MLREHLDRRLALAFALGAIPGGILGGFVASYLPALVIHVTMGFMALLAVWRSFSKRKLRRIFSFPSWVIAGAGLVIGVFCAAASGAGLLLASLLLVSGLGGRAYVATAAICAAALHAGRLVGYGVGGLLGASSLLPAAALALAIVAGNLLGERLRPRLPARAEPWIEQGTLVACVLLVFLGAVYSR